MNNKILKRVLASMLAIVLVISSITGSGFTKTAKVMGASTFPATGVHKGTLSHGTYYNLSGLYASTGAKVIEADTMQSNDDKRACFCLSAGESETTKKDAYTSSNYNSGYGIKYFKALMQFYYDKKDDYKDNAIRFATGIFVWRTVYLERTHKKDWNPSDYNSDGFKSGFISSMKNIFSYSDTTAENIYEKAYDYIQEGKNGKYNEGWDLLKWTAAKSQTMLTGKTKSAPKSVKIKINKDISISNTGLSLSGTKYELRKDSNKESNKVATFTLNDDGIDTISLSQKGTYASTVDYYIVETNAAPGLISNEKKTAIHFTINWSKVKGDGGTAYIKKDGLDSAKGWFSGASGFKNACKSQLIDEPAHTHIDVEKIEKASGKKLGGAQFTIYAFDKKTGKYTTVVNTGNNLNHAITNPITTNAQGKASSGELYFTDDNQGKFIIKETKAPEGCVNHKESKLFQIPSGKKITDQPTPLKYRFEDDEIPVYTDLHLQKINAVTNEPIFDAEFTVYVLQSPSTKEYVKWDWYSQHAGEAGVRNSDAEWVEWKKMVQNKDYYTNELTNTYTAENLSSARSYMVEETKRPKGYYTDRKYIILGHGASYSINSLADYDKAGVNYYAILQPKADNTIDVFDSYGQKRETLDQTDSLTVSNVDASGFITVKKVDEEDNTKPLPGATFELWQVSKEEYDTNGYVPNAENGDIIIDTGVTGEDGTYKFGEQLKGEDDSFSGNTIKAEYYYLLMETKAPEGYAISKNPITKVHIPASEARGQAAPFFDKTYTVTNKELRLDLKINKISVSRTGKESVALPGAKFALYKVDNIIADEETNDLTDEQLADVADGSDSDGNGINDSTEEAIENDGDTDILDNDTNEGLTNKNYIDYDYSKLTPIEDNIITDSNGKAVVSDKLKAGGYVLVEKEAPKNYKVADPQYIFIDNEKLESTVPYEIEVVDEEFEAEVQVIKKDIETGEIIKRKGIGFKIKNLDTDTYVRQTVDTYAKPEVEGAPHELISSEETDVFYTDETGTVTLPNVLAVGSYQMEEYVAPDGYTINPQPVPFIVDDEMDLYPGDPDKLYEYDENTREVVIPVESKDTPTSVDFSKKSITNNEELPGCKLKVVDSKGNTIESWTSTEKPHVIKGLTIGETYQMVETKPADGYVTAESVIFTVRDTNDLQHVEMFDEVTKTHFAKTDITNGKPVIGAQLTILTEDGKVIDTWTTTKEEHIIEQLPIGKYILRENIAPDVYVTATDIHFEVKDTSKIQKVTMADDVTKVKVVKVDKNTDKHLKGAKFDVLDSEGKKVTSVTTDADGQALITAILKHDETYTLHETKAPKGYQLTDDIEFNVEDTPKVQTITVSDKPLTPDTPNTPGTPNTPKTGNIMNVWQYVLGIGLGFVVLCVLLRKKRKSRV